MGKTKMIRFVHRKVGLARLHTQGMDIKLPPLPVIYENTIFQ